MSSIRIPPARRATSINPIHIIITKSEFFVIPNEPKVSVIKGYFDKPSGLLITVIKGMTALKLTISRNAQTSVREIKKKY